MSLYRHDCSECKYKAEDAEVLRVCPDCASDKITNDPPVNEFSDEFIEEEDIQEDFEGKPWYLQETEEEDS